MCQVHLQGQVSAQLVFDSCAFIYSKPSSAYLKVLKVQGEGQGLSPASKGSPQGSWAGTCCWDMLPYTCRFLHFYRWDMSETQHEPHAPGRAIYQMMMRQSHHI